MIIDFSMTFINRAKSVPSSPMVKRAFSRLGTLTAGWGRSIRGKQQLQLTIDDKKKWSSSHDCSSIYIFLRFASYDDFENCLHCVTWTNN